MGRALHGWICVMAELIIHSWMLLDLRYMLVSGNDSLSGLIAIWKSTHMNRMSAPFYVHELKEYVHVWSLQVITSDQWWNNSPVNGLVSISPSSVWTLKIMKLEQNGRCISRKHFQLHGFERKSSRNCICILIFDLRTYHEICSRTSNWR